MLWLRPLDAMRHTPIPGTEGATNPFWSPDGQYLAYFSGRALKMVRVKDYATETICKVEGTNGGGTWNRDGIILFARNIDDGLYQVAAKPNANPSPIVKVKPQKGENAYLWPQFLPDGKHFLFFVQAEATETTGVYTGAIDSSEYRLLFPSETNALYSGMPEGQSQKNGYLLYIGNRKLMGQAFHAAHLAIVGEPVTLADDIGAVSSMNLAPITVANNGTMAYQSTGKATRQLIWTDRAGTQLAAVREPGEWGPPRIAPDGRRAAVGRLGEGGRNADLWLVDNDGTMKSLMHVDGQSEGSPVWSPDGSKIAFWVNSQGSNYDIYVRSIEGGGRPELLFHSSFAKHPTDWSRDGRYLFFNSISEGTKYDVWGVSTADRHAGPILDTVSSEQYAALSPDGKWLAYNSDDTNRPEVYVQQFDGISPGTKKRWKVSSGGGGLPRWRADGNELFYLTPNGRVMSVTVKANGADLSFDTPVRLFQTRPLRKLWNLYDVSADGQRFLVNAPLEWALSSDIMVVTNWTEKLKD
jgi:Tol biopolymer transport system component